MTREEIIAKIDQAAFSVTSLHNKNGGSTFNLITGDLSGKAYYAVSPQKANEVKIQKKKIKAEWVRGYIVEHIELLKLPTYSVGTWYDENLDCTFLDISVTIKDKGKAVKLAQDNYQKAIYDLFNHKEIIL